MNRKEIDIYITKVKYSCKTKDQLNNWFNWAISVIQKSPEFINIRRLSMRSLRWELIEFERYLESKASDINS
jgi:hypothetical protein